MIKPFLANVPQPVLDDLRLRIQQTRWPDEIVDSGWSYGTNLSFLKELSEYWLHVFDWRKVETAINVYPNFTADIYGHTIHFLHIKGKGSNCVPLIITHGWPGSFIEMMKLIPLLTEGEDISFDLVIPSVQAGFSQRTPQLQDLYRETPTQKRTSNILLLTHMYFVGQKLSQISMKVMIIIKSNWQTTDGENILFI